MSGDIRQYLLPIQATPTECQYGEQQDPRSGIRCIDKTDGHGICIDHGHPQKAQHTGAQQIDDYGSHRTAAAPDRAGKYIGDTENEIKCRHNI